MATPDAQSRDSALYDFCGTRIRDYISNKYQKHAHILDIGAGWGKYKLLLPSYDMDAIEAWWPYVQQNDLSGLYDAIYVVDIRHWTPHRKYAVAIFGDCLEHLAPAEARAVLDCLRPYVGEFVIAVPYEMKQDAVDGNPFEEHKQADLTHALMQERYPELQRIALWENRAVYVG